MRNANSQPGIRRTADENTDADEKHRRRRKRKRSRHPNLRKKPQPRKSPKSRPRPHQNRPRIQPPANGRNHELPSDLSGQLDEAWLRCSPPFCREGAPPPSGVGRTSKNNPTPELFSWKRSLNHDGVWLHITEGGMDGSVQQACMDSLFGGAKSEPTGEWTEIDLNGISRWQKQDDGAAGIIWKSAD